MAACIAPPATLIEPYGGKLVNLLVSPETYPQQVERAGRLPSVPIGARAQ